MVHKKFFDSVMLSMVQAIKEDLASVRPSVAECRQTADQLSTLCGSPSDVTIHKCITDLDTALSDIDEGLDDRELELNRMLDKAQQCTTCLDVRGKFTRSGISKTAWPNFINCSLS